MTTTDHFLGKASSSFSQSLDYLQLKLRRNSFKHPTSSTVSRASLPASSQSAFGEILLVEILAAKDLRIGDFFNQASDPYVQVQYQHRTRCTSTVQASCDPVYNDRFIFWTAEPVCQSDLYITVFNKNLLVPDERLGRVVLGLKMPVSTTIDRWYRLSLDDATPRFYGSIHLGVRRVPIASVTELLAAQHLSSNNRPIEDADVERYGSTLQHLWDSFTEAEEPQEEIAAQEETLASKFNVLGRRLLGRRGSVSCSGRGHDTL